jgi:hypothetical protein
MVILRAADRETGTLEIHTDTATGKISALRADPRASLVAWDAEAAFQMRMKVTVSIVSGDATAWARVPEAPRRAYGAHPPPGTGIDAPDAYSPGPDAARFAILRCTLQQIDTLCLGPPAMTRAQFDRQSGWVGGWRVP